MEANADPYSNCTCEISASSMLMGMGICVRFWQGIPSGSLLTSPAGHSFIVNSLLHRIFHHVFTDLKPHLRPHAGRETVMKARPDAGICNLFGKGGHVGPTVGYAGRRRAGRCDLRDFHG